MGAAPAPRPRSQWPAAWPPESPTAARCLSSFRDPQCVSGQLDPAPLPPHSRWEQTPGSPENQPASAFPLMWPFSVPCAQEGPSCSSQAPTTFLFAPFLFFKTLARGPSRSHHSRPPAQPPTHLPTRWPPGLCHLVAQPVSLAVPAHASHAPASRPLLASAPSAPRPHLGLWPHATSAREGPALTTAFNTAPAPQPRALCSKSSVPFAAVSGPYGSACCVAGRAPITQE